MGRKTRRSKEGKKDWKPETTEFWWGGGNGKKEQKLGRKGSVSIWERALSTHAVLPPQEEEERER